MKKIAYTLLALCALTAASACAEAPTAPNNSGNVDATMNGGLGGSGN